MPLKRFASGLILVFAIPLLSFSNNSETPLFSIKTIVLDPGHGGEFHGASGKYSREQDVTLKVAMRLGKAIEAAMPNVKVIYTRTEDIALAATRPADLRERINIANRANADLWISIHCNAPGTETRRIPYKTTVNGKKVTRYKTIHMTDYSTKGVETYVAGSARLDEQTKAIGEYALLREDYKLDDKLDSADPEAAIFLSMINSYLRKKSIRLASFIQDEYIAAGRVNRGFQEQSLAVLRTATMPAVLTEIGFITNPQEEDYINSDSGQDEIVNCLLKAIQSYQKHADTE